jgi:hypothetical protein
MKCKTVVICSSYHDSEYNVVTCCKYGRSDGFHIDDCDNTRTRLQTGKVFDLFHTKVKSLRDMKTPLVAPIQIQSASIYQESETTIIIYVLCSSLSVHIMVITLRLYIFRTKDAWRPCL